MRLAQHPLLDALIGEYLFGSLRGPARKRFARAMRDEAFVAQRVDYWLARAQLQPSSVGAIEPSPEVWKAIARDLDLASYASAAQANADRANARVVTKATSDAPSWRRWFSLPRIVALTAAVVLVAVTIQTFAPILVASRFETIATLSSATSELSGSVTASRSSDGKRMQLQANRTLPTTAQQSFEVWLLPKEGSAPISVAVLAQLDEKAVDIAVPQALIGRINAGAKLAISIEPRGGSTTGAPTGPVVFVGAVSL
jgi:anti-sigma-K factor RskA